MGTLRAWKDGNQMRKAHFRAKSGVRFAVNGEEKAVEISDTSAAGKIQTSAADAKVKSWV